MAEPKRTWLIVFSSVMIGPILPLVGIGSVCGQRLIHSGLLYLVCDCAPAQKIFKSLARGSVADGLTVPDFASVQVPYPDDAEPMRHGIRATIQ
jgi:hypothetical protein